MKRLIIDCDPGNGIAGANVDDGLALALALAAPEISLELITTVSGNTPGEVGYSVALDFVRRFNASSDVARGASSALVEPAAPWRRQLDGKVDSAGLRHLWNDVQAPETVPDVAPLAVQKMGELICSHPGEITLVAIGPLTNVALAMQLYPQMASAVKQIVIMGGAFNVPGYLKDTNFGLDPEAARAVLTSGANIALVPMDVTTRTMMTHADLDQLAALGNPLADYLVQTLRPWMDFSMQTRQLPGCWIHDVLTVAWLLDPTLATAAEDTVEVSLQGISRGKSFRCGPESLRLSVNVPAPAGAPVTILETVDNARLLALIERNIARYA